VDLVKWVRKEKVMGKVRKLNESPLAHCWAGVLHSPETNKMRNRVASYGKGTGNDTSLAEAKKKRSPLNQTDPYKKLTSKFPQFNQATDTVVSGILQKGKACMQLEEPR
jgi:hypothetical protein